MKQLRSDQADATAFQLRIIGAMFLVATVIIIGIRLADFYKYGD